MSRSNWWAFSLFGAITAVLLVLIIFHVVTVKRNGEYSNQGGPELLTKWRGEQFSPIVSTGDFLNLISDKVQAQVLKSDLSVDQKNKLTETVQGMLLAFSSGKYEDYQKFRFPIREGQFNANLLSNFYNGLKKFDPDFKNYAFDQTDPDYPWKTFEKFWFFSGISTNLYCSKCWKEAGILSLKTSVFVHTNAVPELKYFINQNENLGINWYISSFQFEPATDQLLSANKSVDLAVVSIIIMTEAASPALKEAEIPVYSVSDKTKATPVYCLFYWVPSKQVWLPEGFGGAYSGPHKAIYLF